MYSKIMNKNNLEQRQKSYTYNKLYVHSTCIDFFYFEILKTCFIDLQNYKFDNFL